jgi:hypothetical protein
LCYEYVEKLKNELDDTKKVAGELLELLKIALLGNANEEP